MKLLHENAHASQDSDNFKTNASLTDLKPWLLLFQKKKKEKTLSYKLN